jgi:hypothetical protein
LMAPVRFRAVASGLMIEKVRSTAITSSFDKKPRARARSAKVGTGFALQSSSRRLRNLSAPRANH